MSGTEELDKEGMRLLRQILSEIPPGPPSLESLNAGLLSLEKKKGWDNLRSIILKAVYSTNHFHWLDEVLFKFIESKGKGIAAPIFLEIAESRGKNDPAAQVALQAFARIGPRKQVLKTLVKTILAKPEDIIFQIIAARCLSSFKEEEAADAVGSTLIKGQGVSRLDEMGKAEQSLSVEYACAQSLIEMKTERAASWLCAVHIFRSDSAMVKKPLLEMPGKAMPYLLLIIPKSKKNECERAAALAVELGGGKSAIGLFEAKLREEGNEPQRQGILGALSALRKAQESSGKSGLPSGNSDLNGLKLERIFRQPRAGARQGIGLPLRAVRQTK